MLFPVYWMINVSLTQHVQHAQEPAQPDPDRRDARTATRWSSASSCPTSAPACSSALGTVAVTLVLAAPAGYSLAKLRPRGGGALNFVLLIAQMIPAIIMAMGFYTIYIKLGILDTVWGLILADSTIAVPFGVLIFTAFMSRIPDELLQAARIDGRARCGRSGRSSCR